MNPSLREHTIPLTTCRFEVTRDPPIGLGRGVSCGVVVGLDDMKVLDRPPKANSSRPLKNVK